MLGVAEFLASYSRQKSEEIGMNKSKEVDQNQNELLHLLLVSKDTEIGLRNELTQLQCEFAQFREDIFSSNTWKIGKFILGIFGRKFPAQNAK